MALIHKKNALAFVSRMGSRKKKNLYTNVWPLKTLMTAWDISLYYLLSETSVKLKLKCVSKNTFIVTNPK